MRGIKESVRTNVVMTVIEVSGLVLVIVVVGIFLASGNGDLSRVDDFPPGVGPASAVLAASLIAYYSFVGFEVSANVAEEVHDVSRVYPRALFGALLTARAEAERLPYQMWGAGLRVLGSALLRRHSWIHSGSTRSAGGAPKASMISSLLTGPDDETSRVAMKARA